MKHHNYGPQRAGQHPAGLLRHLLRLREMGASNHDLHAVVDAHLAAIGVNANDLGRGTVEIPVDPILRCSQLTVAAEKTVEACHNSLRSKAVLVAGEFPPHLLEELLLAGAIVTQIHPRNHHHDEPPHFYHLARIGLRGLTDLSGLAVRHFDVVLLHGAKVAAQVYVSTLVPIVLQMFKGTTVYLLEDDYPAPHMTVAIPNTGFIGFPSLL